MNKLEELRSVVDSLTSSEKKDVQNKLKKNNIGISKNASLLLFNLILSKKDVNYNNLNVSIYGNRNIYSINKLISRLFEKILDVFIFKDNIVFNELYDKRTQDIFLLERQLLVSEILRFRGLFSLSHEKLENVISRCKYYEHYDILLYALDKKRRWTFLNASEENIVKLNNEIIHFNEVKRILKISEAIYIKVFKFNHETFNDKNKNYIIVNNFKLNNYFRKTKSNQIKFYLFYTKIQHCYLKYQYEKGLNLIQELIDFLLETKSIYSRLKHGNALLNLGLFNRFCFKYELSIQSLMEARKYFLDQHQNNFVVYDQLFLTYYFEGNISKMKYYLTLIRKDGVEDGFRNFSFNKLGYYLSIFNFINQENNISLKNLNDLSFSGESVHFNLEGRILFVLNYIETNRLDLADFAIESLRKYFSRVNTKENIFKNKELIIKILVKLSLNSYNFILTKEKNESYFEKLIELSYSFCFLEYEMLIFHEWFDAKVKGIPYNHPEVMKRLRKNNLKKKNK